MLLLIGFWSHNWYSVGYANPDAYMIFAFLAGLSFMVAGILLLAFTCSKRFRKVSKGEKSMQQSESSCTAAATSYQFEFAGIDAMEVLES